jgi:isopenicillin-N epimerase
MLDLADPLQLELSTRFGIEVLVAPFPAAPRRVLRFTAHLYNDDADYERLAQALVALR